MARTTGTQNIKGWREHGLLRDLALNEESVEDLAVKYDVAVQTVYDWRYRNRHRINVVLAEWSDQFSDLWSVKKHARVADQTVLRGMPETAQALFLKLTKNQRDWFPLEGSFREQWDYLVECIELPHQKRERLAKEKAVEEVQAKWLAEHPPQGCIDAFAAGLATGDQFRAEVAAELAGEVDPKESSIMLDDESDRPRLLAEFAGIEALAERLASDDELRAVVAEMIALGWVGAVPVSGEPSQDGPAGEPAPVDDPVTERDEPVELIRMIPAPAQEAAEPAAPSPDPVDEAEAPTEMPPVADHVAQAARELAIQVWSTGLIPHPSPHFDHPVDEAEAPTEMPPVADHVAQAARELAIQVWSTGLIPHPSPHFDQSLAHAAGLGWLVVDANRIVQGKVDPRPVTVTRIPNY